MLQQTEIDRALSAARQPVLLESTAHLSSAADQWNDSETLGIDTEFVRERTYRAHLGLIQVSDGKTAWLADPLSLGPMDTMAELMNRQQTTKILHSCSEDLEVLLHVLGQLPEPMVDTQIACALLGQPLQLGYHHAVKWIFDIEIDKDQTRSNWLRRPLTSDQMRYAAMDVVLLPMMYREIRTRLEDVGRLMWLEEDVARMKGNSPSPQEPESAYLRFSAARRLDEATLKVLQALAAWRETTAKSRDLARGFVISDAGLLNLAHQKPGDSADINNISDIHPRALARYREALLEVIGIAQSSDAEVPRIVDLTNAQKKQLDRMKQRVQIRSKEMGIDPALLASKRELEKLIRALANNESPPERFLGWRNEVITEELLSLTS